MSAEPDLIREALQVRINEGGPGVRAGYVVAHYVAVVGLVGVTEDGDTGVVVLEQNGQARYITDGLLGAAPDVLCGFTADSDEEADCDEPD